MTKNQDPTAVIHANEATSGVQPNATVAGMNDLPRSAGLLLTLLTLLGCGADDGSDPDGGVVERDSAMEVDARPLDARAPDAHVSECDDWTFDSIGDGREGSAECVDGRVSLMASGSDIWGTMDGFGFFHRAHTGDLDIRVRVEAFEEVERFSKAGLMVRAGLEADAAYALLFVAGGDDVPLRLEGRRSAGAEAELLGTGELLRPPAWLRLIRRGERVAALASADGESWSAVGGVDLGDEPLTIGLAVTSSDPEQLATGTFGLPVLAAPPASCTVDVECRDGETCDAGTCRSNSGFVGHEAILDDIVGYAEGVTGGAGGTLIEVTNTNDSGPGSLREAIAVEGPTWIHFSPGLEGTIDLEGLVYLRSDTTIDGRGANVAIGGFTMNVYEGSSTPANNIVLHNLRFTGGVPDARTLLRVDYGSTGVWIDHVSFEAQSGDGKPLTHGNAATDITVSWCDFSRSEVSLIYLIGPNNESPGDANMRVTGHHNLLDMPNGTERHPRIRYATVHWFNNVVASWSDYGSSISQDGRLFAENNIYWAKGSPNPSRAIITRIGNWPANGDPLPGNLRHVGNWWKEGTPVPDERNPELVLAPPYAYDAEVADSSLEASIRSESGWQDVPSPFE